jgi:hypothetical protein
MTEGKYLDRRGMSDLNRTFPLLKELFDMLRKRGWDSYSYQNYGSEDEGENTQAIELPENFSPLVAEHPGKYYIVAYDNRRDSYYNEGTRHELVKLSTVKKKAQSDERVTEVDLVEVDPSMGNKVEVRVHESVNNKGFTDINKKTNTEVAQPHGDAEYKYEIDPNGNKEVKETSYSRTDEGIFPWNDNEERVRWYRTLRAERKSEDNIQTTYEDSFIIGGWDDPRKEERASIRTTIKGAVENPDSIVVEIGIGAPSSAQVLYEDTERNIKVLVHEGINMYKNQLEVLKQDPNYASIFQEPTDVENLMNTLKSKIAMLQNDWDKPHHVFAEQPAINGSASKQLNS